MSAKAIRVAPVARKTAETFVARNHYSGSYVRNSQLHLGAFVGRRLVGVAQFGPPMDRRKLVGLVAGTSWNGLLELNRLAMVDDTPRNTESRFLSVCFRLIRRHYPHVEWIVSFADATQCGDGTIYRAAGFVLTAIKRNDQVWAHPDDGDVVSRTSMTAQGARGGGAIRRRALSRMTMTKGAHTAQGNGAASMKPFIDAGYVPLPGWQLRYVWFSSEAVRARLTVPEIPFSRIAEVGATMYRGNRARSIAADAPAIPAGEDGSAPIRALQT